MRSVKSRVVYAANAAYLAAMIMAVLMAVLETPSQSKVLFLIDGAILTWLLRSFVESIQIALGDGLLPKGVPPAKESTVDKPNVGVGVDHRTIDDYEKAVNELLANRDTIVKTAAQHPVCIDFYLIRFHAVVTTEAEVDLLIDLLQEEVDLYHLRAANGTD